MPGAFNLHQNSHTYSYHYFHKPLHHRSSYTNHHKHSAQILQKVKADNFLMPRSAAVCRVVCTAGWITLSLLLCISCVGPLKDSRAHFILFSSIPTSFSCSGISDSYCKWCTNGTNLCVSCQTPLWYKWLTLYCLFIYFCIHGWNVECVIKVKCVSCMSAIVANQWWCNTIRETYYDCGILL